MTLDMHLTLTVISYKGAPPSNPISISIEHESISIGRQKGNSLVLNDPESIVSSKHAEIEYRDDGYYLTDTSTNHTLIDQTDEPLNESQTLRHGQSAKLNNNNLLTFGDYEIMVEITSHRNHAAADDLSHRDGYENPDSLLKSDDKLYSGSESPFADIVAVVEEKEDLLNPKAQNHNAMDDFSFIDSTSGSDEMSADKGLPNPDATGLFADITSAQKDKDNLSHANAPAHKATDDFSFLDSIEKAPLYDENVRFTVYRPKQIPAATWEPLLAFAHLSDAPPDEPDPEDEVKRQAEAILGSSVSDYDMAIDDASQSIPREGWLTFVPAIKGVEFNPANRTFRWQESVHKEEFRMRADAAAIGKTLRGRFTIYWGAIIVGDMNLTIKVGTAKSKEMQVHSAAKYRDIFPSYSHNDVGIVQQFMNYASGVGDKYLQDVIELRAGQEWSEELRRLIRKADIFQLFWSWSSMRSPWVRQEWEYALELAKSGTKKDFIRGTYWESPMPEKNGLPPARLKKLHFQRVHVPANTLEPSQVEAKRKAEEESKREKAAQAKRKAVEASNQRQAFALEPSSQADSDLPLIDILLDALESLETGFPQRLEIGDILEGMAGGDPRYGTGQDERGLPDIEWVHIPAGEFIYGEANEQTRLHLDTFEIARYPVTNRQYQCFIDDGGYKDERWWTDLVKPEIQQSNWPQGNRPRVYVNLYEATAFCRWLSAQRDETIALPNEYQWERAARGKNGLNYPWGDEYQPGYANTHESKDKKYTQQKAAYRGQTTPVGLYPQGRSPEGAEDMSGNVWEWCRNPNYASDRESLIKEQFRVLRGGCWALSPDSARAARRYLNNRDCRNHFGGFRLVRSPP